MNRKAAIPVSMMGSMCCTGGTASGKNMFIPIIEVKIPIAIRKNRERNEKKYNVKNLLKILIAVRFRVVPRGENERPIRMLSRMLAPKALALIRGLLFSSCEASGSAALQSAHPLISSKHLLQSRICGYCS
jgi:hypothetical protein